MQITKAEVIPVELPLRRPVRMAGLPEIRRIQAVFVRIETRQGRTAWGCTVAHPELTGERHASYPTCIPPTWNIR
jgi:L-alanine-DL-glutamate epimerase-like enolase superfamily enzyme